MTRSAFIFFVALAIALSPRIACSQSSAPAATFDDCLITHIAAISTLQDSETKEGIALHETLIASQTELVSDNHLTEDELAQRTSLLTQAYGRAAQKVVAEAYANGISPKALAADAIACGKELAK